MSTGKYSHEQAVEALRAITGPFDVRVQRRRTGDGKIEEIHYETGLDADRLRDISGWLFPIAGGGHYLLAAYTSEDRYRPAVQWEANVPGNEMIPEKFKIPGVSPGVYPAGVGALPQGAQAYTPWGGAPGMPGMTPQGNPWANMMPQPWMFPPTWGHPLWSPQGGGQPVESAQRTRMTPDDIMSMMATRMMMEGMAGGPAHAPGNGAGDKALEAIRSEIVALREAKTKGDLDALLTEIKRLSADKSPQSAEVATLKEEIKNLREASRSTQTDKSLEALREGFTSTITRIEAAITQDKNAQAVNAVAQDAARREQDFRGLVERQMEQMRGLVEKGAQVVPPKDNTALYTMLGTIAPALLSATKTDMGAFATMISKAMETSSVAAQSQQAQGQAMLTAVLGTVGNAISGAQKATELPPWLVEIIGRQRDTPKDMTTMAEAATRIMGTSIEMTGMALAQMMQMVAPQQSPWLALGQNALNQITGLAGALLTPGSQPEPPPQVAPPAPTQALPPAPAPTAPLGAPPTSAGPTLPPLPNNISMGQGFATRLQQAVQRGIPADQFGRAVEEAYSVMVGWGALDQFWAALPDHTIEVVTEIIRPTGRLDAPDGSNYLAAAVASTREALARRHQTMGGESGSGGGDGDASAQSASVPAAPSGPPTPVAPASAPSAPAAPTASAAPDEDMLTITSDDIAKSLR